MLRSGRRIMAEGQLWEETFEWYIFAIIETNRQTWRLQEDCPTQNTEISSGR